MNARGALSCDQAVRLRHVRGVGDGDEEQKAEESVEEHDVEMQGGPEEETIEMVSTDCTARSTMPFDPLLLCGAHSLMVRAPVRFTHTHHQRET